jgi:uncharacterized protein (TIGR00299 family) protein
MRVALVDPICGASGDMLLGALVDAGVAVDTLKRAIDALGLDDVKITATRVRQRGIAATRVVVNAPHEHAHRHLPDIERILRSSRLEARIVQKAGDVFRRLAEAEARVHDIAIDEVHFHEVGALDAIADVVGVVAGFESLGIGALYCRALPVSHGTVRCAHGLLPVPAPAVGYLMQGVPTEPLDEDGETLTPTAAALLRELVTHWGGAPPMTLLGQGFGAGTKEFGRPNVVRLMIGDTVDTAAEQIDELVMLTTNIDDMNPEWLPPLVERLFAAGARDAWLTPILMKKGRPAHSLSVLCDPAIAERLRHIVYIDSTSLGIREERVRRYHVPRAIVRVATRWGEIGVKVADLPNGTQRASPEFADCADAAQQNGVTIAEVYEAALAAWRTNTSC